MNVAAYLCMTWMSVAAPPQPGTAVIGLDTTAQQAIAGPPSSLPATTAGDSATAAKNTPAEKILTPGASCNPCPGNCATLPEMKDPLGLGCARKPLQSDLDFPDFIGPITNPILSKDPRSNTYARFLFLNNVLPSGHPIGGDFQVYGLQLNLALNERLSIIADKDGIIALNPNNAPSETGWANINLGLKYTFYRDVENQALMAAGFTYEIPTGSERVLQGYGGGVTTLFLSGGKEFGDKYHLLGTTAYQFGLNKDASSSFFYASVHLDKQCCGWLYPLVEFNYYHYTQGGERFPQIVGEGDGLLNLGTQGVAGNNLFTTAIGLKAILSECIHTGIAWEFPLSNRQDLIDNRINFEFIVRY